MKRDRIPSPLLLLVLLAACAAHKPATGTDAKAQHGPDSLEDRQGCLNSTSEQDCFDSARTTKEGSVVTVKNRLVHTHRECRANRYCQCVVATIETAPGTTARAVRCWRTYFSRGAVSDGEWVEQKYDFGAPVKSVDEVNYSGGSPTR